MCEVQLIRWSFHLKKRAGRGARVDDRAKLINSISMLPHVALTILLYANNNKTSNDKAESGHNDGKQQDWARGRWRNMGIQGKQSGDNLMATNLLYLPLHFPYYMPCHSIIKNPSI